MSLADDDVEQLKKEFEKGVVFDFKTHTWSLSTLPLLPTLLHYQARRGPLHSIYGLSAVYR